MHKLKILNTKEKKKLIARINEYFGSGFSTDKVFLQDEKGNLYLVNKDIANIDFSKLKLEKAGLFFGKIDNKELILSVEGSQLLGEVNKNFIELGEDKMKEYLSGEIVIVDIKDGEYLLKCNDDYLGSAKVRNKKILNALPRNRRVNR